MQSADNPRLTHPKAILVATNLSDLSRLMPFALQMAGDSGARLQLLHVLPTSAEFTADATGMPYYDRQGAISEANNMLEPWSDRARRLGLRCAAIVRDGQPVVREILEAINQFHPDRLILGTRSLGRLGKLLLGSVAEQVLRSVNLPVFTVGPEAHLQENNGRQPTVLFATTLGDGHQANAALACKFATAQGAKLIMFHVLPNLTEGQMDGSNILLSTIKYELRALAHRIGAGSGTDVEIKVAHGNPANQILAESVANRADLIVMGAGDHSMFDSIAHDRTVCRVLAHAHCPVLSLHGSTAQRPRNQSEAAVAVH
jgi:nucleotide-binding universal stress UspA family protein